MAKVSVAETVRSMSGPVVEELGLDLVDVEFVREAGRQILRVYIDKPGGVSHNDCEAVSKRLDVLLDEKDPIPEAYYLEVSSPGIERPLKKLEDFRRFSGHTVKVTTFSPVEGKKKFTGKLAGVDENAIVLEDGGIRTSIPMGQVASARLQADL